MASRAFLLLLFEMSRFGDAPLTFSLVMSTKIDPFAELERLSFRALNCPHPRFPPK
jgi:hypothetical protein